ncbi:MAG: ABC transporter substrate-binding protein [Symploca sp. SIO1A3]|nr:ABC transporter substrate-binding protein [Symploca sp. SIO1A3]
MDDLLRQTLCQIIKQDHSLHNNQDRCRAMLCDLRPEPRYHQGIEAIVAAMQQRIPARLLALPKNSLSKKQLETLSKKMQSNQALSEDIAQWVIESWAQALQVQVVQTNKSGMKFKKPLLYGIIACLLLTAGGTFVVYRNFSSEGITEAKWEAERFSRGQRTLFPGDGNTSRDLGIVALQNENYSEAVQLFERAVTADRNDPEVLIYYNNARARQQGSPLTLAVVVPVDNRGTSAKEMLRGVAQAQDQFNDSMGLNGRLLEIVIANDGNEPAKATQVAKELVNDKSIIGVIGHNASSASKAGLAEYEKANLAIISPTSTSTSLTSEVFFRTVPSDAAAGKKLASYAKNTIGIDNVVIFYNPNSSYSRSLKESFQENFVDQLGGKITRTIDLSDPNLDVWAEVSTTVLQERVKVALLFPDSKFTSVAIEITQANSQIPKEQRLKWLGGDALYSPTTLKAGGVAVEGLVLAVPWFVKLPQAEDFSTIAKKQWGGLVNWRTATSFDATQAFIKALLLSNNPSRATVLEKLLEVNLAASETSGVSLQFTEKGERESEPILVEVARGGVRPPESEVGFDLVN